MVTWQSFPSAYFGRNMSESKIGSYSLLGHSPDFPVQLLDAFESLHGYVRWLNSSQQGRYPDCYGTLPLSPNRLIIARFQDAGPDSLDRPHTLRIEGILVEGMEITKIRELCWQLFEPNRWRVAGPEEHSKVELRWDVEQTNQQRNRESSFEKLLRKPTFLCTHSFFENLCFENVYDLSRSEYRSSESEVRISTPTEPSPKQRTVNAREITVKQSSKGLRLLWGLSLAATIVSVYSVYLNLQNQRQFKETKVSLNNNEREQAERDELQSNTRAMLQSLDSYKSGQAETAKEVSHLRSEYEQLNEKVNDLQANIETAPQIQVQALARVRKQIVQEWLGSKTGTKETSIDAIKLLLFLEFFSREKQDSNKEKVRKWLENLGNEESRDWIAEPNALGTNNPQLPNSFLVKQLQLWLVQGKDDLTRACKIGLKRLDELLLKNDAFVEE